MVKKFLFVLSICLFLTSCGSKTNQENENQKNEISISNNENSKKEISKNLSSKDDKNPYQNIYDLLKGKKLVFLLVHILKVFIFIKMDILMEL